jgi:hypothetical protein
LLIAIINREQLREAFEFIVRYCKKQNSLSPSMQYQMSAMMKNIAAIDYESYVRSVGNDTADGVTATTTAILPESIAFC